MNYKLKIERKDSVEWMFIISSIMAVIAPSTIWGYTGIMLFLSLIALKVMINRKYAYSVYFLFEAAFIVYAVFQYLYIGVLSSQYHFVYIKTMTITLVFNIGLFLFIQLYGYVKAILDYCVGISIGFLVLIVLCTKSIFRGGLAAVEYQHFYIFKIGGVASVYLGWIAAIGFILVYFLYLEEKNTFRFILSLFLAITVILTGRRKILLFLAVAVIGGKYFRDAQMSAAKKIRWIFVTILTVLIGYYCLTKIPVLYNFIGKRLIDAVQYIFDDSITITDSSLRTRATLLTRAEKLWRKNKVWGQGFGSFILLNKDIGYYSHNNYWELLVGNGIVGLVLYYIKYIYLLFVCFKKNRKHTNWRYKYLFVMVAVFMVLEYWQITFMYRHLTVFLIVVLGILMQKENSKK